MSTTVAIVLYVAYAGWRAYVDRQVKQRQQASLDAVTDLKQRVERLEQRANNGPYGLPTPLDL